MKIYGLQKMTLLDFPERVACTIFTGGCNFRCPFCHNALLVTEIDKNGECYTEEDILAFLQKRTGLLDGVCITGGEPLMNPDIADFISKIKELGFAVKLDTNGSYPERLLPLIEKGLIDYVAMDIKNCRERYCETAGVQIELEKIDRSIEILKSGKIDYEFRTTVVKELHTVENIAAAAEWIGGAEKYFLQNFIDSGCLIGENMHPHTKETLLEMCEIASKSVKRAELRGV